MADEVPAVEAPVAAPSPGLAASFAASTNPAPAAAAPAAVAAPAVVEPAAPALAVPPVEPALVATPARPEGLPEAFWDAQANAPKWADIATRAARADELEAAETARTADVPADAAGYKLEVTGDPILGIDGKPVGFVTDDPMAKAMVGVAAEHKLTQGQFSALARAYAQSQVDMAKAMQASVAAETQKLGPTAGDRIKAVVNFATQHGKESAPALIQALYSADAVIALERIMAAAGQPAIGGGNGQGPVKSIAETWFPKSMKSKS